MTRRNPDALPANVTARRLWEGVEYRNTGTDTNAHTYSCAARLYEPEPGDGGVWTVAAGFTHAGGSIDGNHDRFVVARPTRSYKSARAAWNAAIRWTTARR